MFRIFAIAVSAATVLIFLSINISAHPPWGIVVDNQGQVYVSDLETVWKIDAQGRQSVFRKGLSGRHTHELTIDEAGNLFGEDLSYEPSTQRYTTAIWKMTPAGSFSYVLAPTVNPITKTNWEGTGVTPDVAVPKEQALKTAYIMALNKSLEKIPYEYIKAGMKEIINQTQKELDEMKNEPKKTNKNL